MSFEHYEPLPKNDLIRELSCSKKTIKLMNKSSALDLVYIK